MENQNNRKEDLRKRIEEVLRSRKSNLNSLSSKSLEEILEEVSIYHQELEYQNLELHRIQDELEQSKSHYFELFQDAPLGYVVVNDANEIQVANKMFATMVGFKPEVLKEKKITSFIHPDFQDQYYLFVKNIIKEKVKSSILIMLSGVEKEYYTKLECNIQKTENGKLLRMGFLDVTREVINEQQLIESRERYRAVADYAYHWEYWQDSNGRLLYMSPSCERITGYSKFEFFENPELLENIIHPIDRHFFDEHKSLAIIPGETKVEHIAEYRITRKDGEVRWIGHACQNIFMDDGTHIGLRATNRDITERKKIREKFIENLNLLSHTQEIAHIGSWELDVETNNLFWSDEIYRIFGIAPQQFEGSYEHFLETVHPHDRDEVNAAYVNSLKNEANTYEIEHRIIRKDNNEVRYVYEKCYHERDNNGRVIRSVGMVQDITQRKIKEKLNEIRLNLHEYTAKHSLNELLTKTLDEVEKITGSTIGFYHFLSDDEKTISLQAWSTATAAKFCSVPGADLHYDIDKAGVWVDCVRERKPIIHNDYAKLKHKKGMPNGHAELVRELVVPIFRANKIVAILGVGNKPTDYNDFDIETVSYLADVAWQIAYRKKTEEEKEKWNKKVNSILESISDAFFALDNELVVTYFNHEAERILNRRASDVLGKPLFDSFPEARGSLFEKEYTKAIKDKRSTTFEVFFTPHSQWYSVRVYSQDNGISIYFQVITERKQWEQKLVISDRIFNHALDMLCIAGFDGYFKTLNPSWSKVLGYSNDELLAKPWLEYVHPDDKEATQNVKSSLLYGIEVYQFENRYICKDGSIKWLSWNSFPYPKENIMFGVARDVTYKKQAEEKLRNSELKLKDQNEELTVLIEELNQTNEEYRNIMEELSESQNKNMAMISAIPDIMFVFDRKGVFLDYHASDNSKLLTSPKNFLGKNAKDVVPEYLAEMNQQSIDKLFETGEPQSYSYTAEINGQVSHFDARMVKLGDYKALSIVRDITEQKKDELTIAKNEQYLKTILQTSVDGFWIADLEGNLLEVNQAYCKMSGYSHQELINLKIEHIDVNEDYEEIKKHIENIVAFGSDLFETKHRRKDGTIFVVEVSVTYIDADGGQLICFTRDISERKSAQEKLRKSEERFRNMFQIHNAVMLLIDPETGNIIEGNPAAANFYGYSQEKLSQMNIQELNCLSLSEINSKMKKALGQASNYFEFPHRISNGEVRIVEVHSSPILANDKKILFSIIHDITERTKIEQALIESQQRFQLSMEATKDGLWDWNVKDREAYYSPAYYTMLGYEVGGFPTSSSYWKELVHPDDWDRVKDMNIRCVNGISENIDMEFRMKSYSGEWKWIYSRGRAVERDKKGLAKRIVGTHIDITERKQFEETLKQRNAFIQTVLDNLPIGLALNNIDEGEATYMNKKFQEIYGWSEEALKDISKFFEKIYPDKQYREELMGRIMADIQSGDPERMRWENIKITQENGNTRIVNAVNIPLFEQNTMVSTVLDVTEQKSAEIALQQSEERFKMLFEKAPVGYQSLSEDGHFLEVNETWLSMLGYTKEEVIGKWFGDFLTPEYAEGFKKRFPVFKAQGKIHSEFIMIRKDGSQVFIAFDGRIGYTIKGEFQQTHCTLNDITEQRKAEMALKAKTAELEAIYNSSPLMMCILDENQNVVYANNYLVEFFGKSYEEIINRRACGVFGCVNATDHEMGCGYGVKCPSCDLNNAIAQTIKTGESLRDVEYNAVVGTIGENQDISLMAYTSLIKTQKKLVSLIFVDVSERKEMENALRENEKRLKFIVEKLQAGAVYIEDDFVFLNAASEFITGYNGNELTSVEDWFKKLYGKNWELVFKLYQDDMAAGFPSPRTVEIITKSGVVRQVEFTAYAEKGKALWLLYDVTERLLAEQALSKSEEMMRSSQSVAKICSYSTNLNENDIGKSAWVCSPEFYKIFGIDKTYPHTIEGWAAFIHPDFREEVFTYHESVVKEKKSFNREYKIIRINDGAERWVLGTGELVFDEQGKPIRMHGAIQDITERKQAEEALRESEELFRMLAELAPVGIVISDENQSPIFLSPTFTNIFGYTIQDIPTVNDWFKLAYPDQNFRKKVQQEWLETTEEAKLTGGAIKPLEFPVHCKDKSVKQIEFRLAISGKMNIIIFTDITERKSAEEALRESEERFRGLYENATVGIYRTTPEGQILMANPALIKMLEYSSFEELAKRNLSDEGYEANYARTEFMKLIDENGEVMGLESAWKTKNGRLIYISESARVVRNSNGNILYYEGTIEDITQRKKAVDALRASEERISSIFRVAPIGIGVVINRVLTEVNQTVCDIIGYTKEELIGKSAQILYPSKEEFEYVGKEKYRQISERGTGTVETLWQKKDGSSINILLSSTPIAQNDLTQGVTFTALDITQRKQADRLVKGRLKLLEFADTHSLPELIKETLAVAEDLTGSQIGFYHFIDEGKGQILLNQWSDRTEKEFCKVTDSFNKHYPIDKAGIWVECIKKRKPIIHNNYQDLPNKNGLPKGHAVLVRELTVPVFRNKRIVAVLGIGNKATNYSKNDIDIITQLADMAWDIAERKMAEEQVLKLTKGIEQSPAIVVITDTQGAIEYANPKFTEVTGYSLNEVLGQNPRVLKSGHQSIAFYQNLWDTILRGNDWQGDMLNLKKNGEFYWESASISPIKNEKGEIKHFIAIKEDITDRKRAEEALIQSEYILKEKNEEYLALNEELTESNQRINQINKDLVVARKKAEESDKLKTAFLANMSHEIRTPMNAIIGFSEMLLNPSMPSERKQFFTRILNTSCHQLLSVVEDVIDIAKIETGQMDIHEGQININHAISRVQSIFDPQTAQQGVEITTTFPLTDDYANILTDSTKLNQVLTNLVSNAAKFTEQGSISISYSFKDNYIEFCVKDTGLGISPEHHEVIFERFRQVELESTRKYGGTGLGLSISRAFVEALGGRIWVESDIGKGSSFYFTLPYKPANNISKELSSPLEPNFNFTGKIILVAEDEDANFMLISEMISDTGGKVLRAENGKEAVEICNRNQDIDIVLMDIKMPVMNGIDATRAVKAINDKLPVIALTAYALSGDREKCFAAGCDEYLSKPITMKELMRVLSEYLDKK